MDELLKRANKLKRQMYRRAGKDINSESTINDINNWLNKENLDFTYFLKCVAYQQFSDFDNIADFTLAAYSKAKELQRFQDETLEAAEQLVLIEELIDKADKLYKLTDGGLFDIHCLAAPLGSFDAKVVRQKDSSCAVMLFDTNLLALSNHVAKYIYTLLELDELDCSNASKSKDVYKLVGKNLSKAEGDVICDIANVCQTGKLPENIPPIFLKTGILGGIEKKATFLPDLPHFDCDPEHSTEMFAEFLKSAFDRSSAEKHEGQPCEGKKYRNNTLEDKLCESARGFIVFHELSHVYEEKSLNYDQGAYSESDIEYFKKIHMESNGLYKWPEPEVIYRRSKQHEREYNADFNSLLLLLSLEKGKKHYQNLGQVDLTVMAGVFISLYTIEIIERFVDISMNGSENILREFNTDDHFSKSFFLRDSHPAPIARIDMLYSNLHQMPDDFFEGIEKHIFLNSVQDLILSIVGTFETLWKILYRPFADGNGIRTSRPAPEILARSIHLSFYEDLSNYKRFISNPAKDLFVFMQYGNFPSLTYNEMKEDLKSTKINERLFLKCFLAQRNNPYIKGNHPDDYIESIISLYFKAGNICIGSSISLHNLKKKFESILSRKKTQIDSINIENTINRKIISIEATEKDNIFFLFDQYLIDRIVDICNLSVPTIINKEHLASDPELLFEFNRETIITTGIQSQTVSILTPDDKTGSSTSLSDFKSKDINPEIREIIYEYILICYALDFSACPEEKPSVDQAHIDLFENIISSEKSLHGKAIDYAQFYHRINQLILSLPRLENYINENKNREKLISATVASMIFAMDTVRRVVSIHKTGSDHTTEESMKVSPEIYDYLLDYCIISPKAFQNLTSMHSKFSKNHPHASLSSSKFKDIFYSTAILFDMVWKKSRFTDIRLNKIHPSF